MIQQQKVKTAINTLTQKQVTFSLRITVTGKKKATSKDLKGTKVQKVRKDLKVRMEPKVYQAATAVMAQQVVTDVMAATEKTY